MSKIHFSRTPIMVRILISVMLVGGLLSVGTTPGLATPDLDDVIVPSDVYPSDICLGNFRIFTGYIGNVYVLLGLWGEWGEPETLWMCFALDDGTVHYGGRVEINGGALGVPEARANEAADCYADGTRPENIRIRSGTYGGGNEYSLDVTPSPGGASEVWICTKIEPYLDYKVVIPALERTFPLFRQDLPVSRPYPVFVSPGSASSYCQVAGGEQGRIINETYDASWLYVWRESVSKAHICWRNGSSSPHPTHVGARISVDTNGGQTLIAPVIGTLAECTWDLISDDGPPPFSIYLDEEPPGTTPLSVCVTLGTAQVSLTFNSSGGQGVVSVTPDS